MDKKEYETGKKDGEQETLKKVFQIINDFYNLSTDAFCIKYKIDPDKLDLSERTIREALKQSKLEV